MPTLFLAILAAVSGIVAIAVVVSLTLVAESRKRTVIQRLGRGTNSGATVEQAAGPVFYNPAGPAAGKSVFHSLPGVTRLSRVIAAAGMDWKPELVLLSMGALAVFGAVLGGLWRAFVFPELSIAGLGLLFGSLPYLYIARKRTARLNAFESQFPETLDFISRAVRAGHALSVSLELLASDAPEPTRTEFRRVFMEHNLGASIESALKGLIVRVPLVDVRFFVSAVLLQRETGGNLSEILTNLAEVIRDRFQLKGRVRAASAHGRMTALALTIIPLVLLVLLSLMRPDYLTGMKNNATGRIVLLGAMAGQIVGYLLMKRIINIKV